MRKVHIAPSHNFYLIKWNHETHVFVYSPDEKAFEKFGLQSKVYQIGAIWYQLLPLFENTHPSTPFTQLCLYVFFNSDGSLCRNSHQKRGVILALF